MQALRRPFSRKRGSAKASAWRDYHIRRILEWGNWKRHFRSLKFDLIPQAKPPQMQDTSMGEPRVTTTHEAFSEMRQKRLWASIASRRNQLSRITSGGASSNLLGDDWFPCTEFSDDLHSSLSRIPSHPIVPVEVDGDTMKWILEVPSFGHIPVWRSRVEKICERAVSSDEQDREGILQLLENVAESTSKLDNAISSGLRRLDAQSTSDFERLSSIRSRQSADLSSSLQTIIQESNPDIGSIERTPANAPPMQLALRPCIQQIRCK